MQYYTVMKDGMGVPYLYPVDISAVGGDFPQVANGGIIVGNNVGDTATNAYAMNDTASALTELAALHNTLLVNSQLISSGTGNDPASQDPTTVVQRPWLTMPEGGVPFDPAMSEALDVVGTTITVVTLVVPDGYDGVINAYSWNFTGGGFVQGSGDLVAQLLRNGAPIRNYDNILVEKGTIAIPRPISPLRIYSGQIITLIVMHASNGLLAGNIVASLVGYFYPSLS